MTMNLYMLLSKKAIAAAADVIRAAYAQGSFALDPEETAEKMLEAARSVAASPFRFRGRMADGRAVEVTMQDKGDVVPGFASNGDRFEAFTTWIRLTFEDVDPDGRFGRGKVREDYIQVDRSLAEKAGDVEAFRSETDRAALANMGLDLASLDEALEAIAA